MYLECISTFSTKLTDNDLRIEMDLLFPEVRFEADYSLNGRVLLLPIVGDGKCIVTLRTYYIISFLIPQVCIILTFRTIKIETHSIR